MTLWLILTVMTALAALYVAAPFLRSVDKAGAEQTSELGIYRDQLAEIDKEAAAGTIDAAAAEQARAEVKRKMLAADKAMAAVAPARPLSALEYKFAFVTITGLTVLGSAILYAYNGNPGLPSATPMMAQSQGGGDASQTAAAAGSAAGLSDVDTMIGKLRERLKANPGDPKGWAMLGWSLMSTGKLAEAVDAYRKAVSIDPKGAGFHVGLADSLIQQASGQVTPEAKGSIDTALSLDGKEPRAMFLRGLGKSQGGDAKGAIDDWIAVLGLAGPTDPWTPEVRGQIEALAKQANIDVSGRLPAVAAAAPAAPSAAANAAPAVGPSAAQVAAAQNMSESDRSAMIKGMVDRLAAKLDATPRNLDGWLQLMRARKVMGDLDGAKAALKKSLEVFADSPPDAEKLKSAAAELGVGS